MSRVLTYEIQEEVYSALEQMAKKAGVETEAYVLEYLARQASTSPQQLSAAEQEAALKRFDGLIGSVGLGRPTGADNETIDADLEREYGASTENGG